MLIEWYRSEIIEGYDNDDIYMMVEDEFVTTAHTFTMHLHQEEYERRKKQAKIRNAAMGGLARPTDPKARMSAETRTNIKAQNAAKRHRTASDGMTDGVQRPRVDSEDDDVGEGTDDDRDDDPWVGTHLHKLMTSPRVSRSLIGLQGVKSSTRAALGYGNASAREPSPTPAAQARVSPRPPVRQPIDVDTTSGEDDDDLGTQSKWHKPAASISVSAPRPSTPTVPSSFRLQRTAPVSKSSRITAPAPSSRIQKTTAPVKFTEPVHQPSTIKSIDTSRSSTSASEGPASNLSSLKFTSRSRMSKLLDDFDQEFESSIKTEPSSPKRNSYLRAPSMGSSNGSRERERERERETKSRKDRLSEVPTFL